MTKKNKGHTEETKEKISKALVGNKNAELYTEAKAIELFDNALDLSYDDTFDFIGEIAREQRVYKDIYPHLIKRFPILKITFDMIKSNLESNCYTSIKTNSINVAAGIINLKSNHKWTDRNDVTSDSKPLKTNDVNITIVTENTDD